MAIKISILSLLNSFGVQFAIAFFYETNVPNKPTEPYGYIAFGKDGTVRKNIEKLSDKKSEQEVKVGEVFANGLAKLGNRQYEINPCEENDHDFWLISKNEKIIVQATEIVSRDYVRKLSQNQYINGEHQFTNLYFDSNGQICGVDLVAKEVAVLNRLTAKIQKNYSKPLNPFWLLIWTVCSDFFPFWTKGGAPQTSDGVIKAREYIDKQGAGPFDEIWFLHLVSRPHRIWPE